MHGNVQINTIIWVNSWKVSTILGYSVEDSFQLIEKYKITYKMVKAITLQREAMKDERIHYGIVDKSWLGKPICGSTLIPFIVR